MNPLIQGKSGTTPVMSRNTFSTNQRTNEDDSQSDPHPEAGVFGNQTMRNSGQNGRRDSGQSTMFSFLCSRDGMRLLVFVTTMAPRLYSTDNEQRFQIEVVLFPLLTLMLRLEC